MNERLSVLIVNFNTSDFVSTSLFSLKRLTKNKYKVFIIDNGSNEQDYLNLKNICKKYNNVFLQRENTKLRGSVAHGTALNKLVDMVDTPYFSILDSDAIWLKKDWDKILIEKLSDKIKVAGTQAPKGKPQDFPLMFAILFETETFRKLKIKFKPKDKLDTGWEIREKYLNNSYDGIILEEKNTRTYKNGEFSEVICAEYYLDNVLFASHFGRGSTGGLAKYNKGRAIFIYRIPIIGKIYIKIKGDKEKRQWISICRNVINRQIGPDKDYYETLTKCMYCKSENLSVVFETVDRLAGKPGLFYLSKCNNCSLFFQNPRIKEKYINEYYTSDIGYCGIPDKEDKVDFKQRIKNYIKKKLPQKFRNVYLDFDYIPKGTLLEIGCSSGMRLEKYKNDGWTVKGIEYNKKTADYAKNKRGLDVKNCRIEEASFNNNSFDIVVMSMVFEHLYSPLEVLDKIHDWLMPGGKIIFSIPNINGLGFKIHKEYSYDLSLPVHIHFFNKTILRECLRNKGFSDIRFDYDWFDRNFVAPWHYKNIDANSKIYSLLAYNKIIRYMFIKPLVFIASLFGKSSRVVISATKK